MSLIFIAFIECVLYPTGHWKQTSTQYTWFPVNGEIYSPHGINAELRLVDIKNDRRYFRFKNHDAKVRIVNNVVIFDDEDIDEEMAVDESKKFPKKKRIDES